ncbi:MAG: arginine decarboxylase, partial [Lentisphaeria bacterium]|nr:arginine decarboxylase [Lentisphaeria bacterium]
MMNGALERLCKSLRHRNITVLRTGSYDAAYPQIETDMDLDCFLLESDMELDKFQEAAALKLLHHIKERQGKVPVFLLADRDRTAEAMSRELMELATEFVWICEDSPEFIAGRISAAIERFRAGLLPPLMKAIWEYNERNHEYSWAAPGHQGGTGFTKNPVGKKFYDFYGENLFRTDTGIERVSIGSLLDHSGAFAESEKNAAKIFGADLSFSVIAGTSGSNRTIMQSVLTAQDIAVCDRNCHKSIEQGLILTGAVPVYLIPSRNRYGIIGPIRRSEMTAGAIRDKINALPLRHDNGRGAVYAVVTNCTYDGLCYNAAKVEPVLAESVQNIHFDEAWYAYARFHPIYQDHFAMRGNPKPGKGPTVFATHSTHKLLNALSQASYIHIRNGENPVDPARFNQAYMMHTTTSPLYAICASNDIAAAMMQQSGQSLIREVIEEAVDFRQAMARLYRDYTEAGSWFFKPWNAEKITCRRTGKVYDFADAPKELLINDPNCWRLEPGAVWHGFDNLEDNWVMLDPIKVSILAPGMGDNGKLQTHGVPAQLVSSYLYQEGIVPTRTTDFQLMFLFSMGITCGKWGTLINALLNFKHFYDSNAPVAEVLPALAKDYPEHYSTIGTRDLCSRMFDVLRREDPTAKLTAAFNTLPKAVITPQAAYRKIVTGDVESVPMDQLVNRVSANS